jgi:hypothetical protein
VEGDVDELAPLTNKERKDNVTFLLEAYTAGGHVPTDVLDAEERQRFLTGEAADQQEVFFKLLCYGVLAAQPAPESVVHADWLRLLGAGILQDVFEHRFDISRYALDPPVSRGDSKGKVIDFVRLSETRDTWARLLPEPTESEVVVDVLYAASGGALKSRAFWVVREMRRYGLWQAPDLDHFGYVPDGRVRKRATRMGLVDMPEKADTFADMKAVSRALHAVMRIASKQNGGYDLPLSTAAQRCEMCDAPRMASCALPHCRWRRENAQA